MRPKAWVKLWVKELFSSSFSLEQRGAWHSFLQLAAESPTEGIISAAGNKGYPDTMLADYLRCSVAKIKEFKALFAKENMVSVDSKGLITITNWTKYQSDTSRVNKWRNATGIATGNATGIATGNATESVQHQSKSKSKNIEKCNTSAAYTNYLKAHNGHINQREAELLGELIDDFGDDSVAAAIDKAIKSNCEHPGYNYLIKVLKSKEEPVFHREIYEEL